MSDSHVVRSHAVRPNRALPVYVVNPILDPCTVTLADPVLAWFIGLIKLSEGKSADKASVTLPTSCPALNDIRLVAISP